MIVLICLSIANKLFNSSRREHTQDTRPTWIDNMIERKISGMI